jgi:hypothetical protein
MVLDIAHLIDRKYVERYQNKFATTAATMRECQMQISGPWPPYHFVHKLTRGTHQTQPAAAAAPAPAVDAIPSPIIQLSEPGIQLAEPAIVLA